MSITNIICLPDLFNNRLSRQHGMLDLIREPIRQGCHIDIAYPPTIRKTLSGLLPGFDLEQFITLAGSQRTPWNIAQAAVDYLFAHIPADTLVLSIDMPPWLAQACKARAYDFIDVRTSPLRFARDLYIAIRSSSADIFQRINIHAVKHEEIRLEAAALAANVRMHKAQLEEEGSFHFDNLDDSLIYIAQTPYDNALQKSDGKLLHCDEFAEQLHTLSQGRRLLYKTTSPTASFVQEERAALTRITGQAATLCQQGSYQILSSNEDLILAGINAEILQEAEWFDKTAHLFYQPLIPLAGALFSEQAYQQIHFRDFLSPLFWQQILTPERPAPVVAHIPVMAHHHARETLDQWGDYSAVMTWGRTLPHESFLRSGGLSLIRRIEALEASEATRHTQETGSGMRRTNKLVVLGNGPSLKHVDLHSLSGVDTIGMNAAYRHWDRINWYPDHYVCLDDQLIETHASAIHQMIVSGKVRSAFLLSKILNYYPDLRDRQNVFFLESFRGLPKKASLRGLKLQSSIPIKGLDPVNGIVTTGAFAVRYGAHLGYSEIAILGVDLRYVEIIPEAQSAGGVKLVIAETPKHNPNYFFDDYQQAGDKYNIPNPGQELHVSAFRDIARDSQAQSWPSVVINSNPQSVLFDEAIFPFVPLEAFIRHS